MKHKLVFSNLLLVSLFLALAPTALATSNWYVDGVHGSDNDDCKSRQTACKTIGHAISLAHSGDSVMVAAATYTENLTIGISLKIAGSGTMPTIDGGGKDRVVTIPNDDGNGHLLKNDQRGKLRPDKQSGICDMGAFERQHD
jgi:nitrous oxidase accessory protein NosD